jgi:hypothetical protein
MLVAYNTDEPGRGGAALILALTTPRRALEDRIESLAGRACEVLLRPKR